MALTKARSSIWAGQTLTAGAANTESAWQDLSGAYAATLSIELTNGATGPTVAAQVRLDVANDYNAGSPSLIVELTTLKGSTANNGVYEWHVELPMGTSAVRLVAGSNTGQNVTVNADVSKVTAL